MIVVKSRQIFEFDLAKKTRQTNIVFVIFQLYGIEYLPSSKIFNMTPNVHKHCCCTLVVEWILDKLYHDDMKNNK